MLYLLKITSVLKMINSDLIEKLKEVKDYNELLQVALWYVQENKLDTMVLGPIFAHGSSEIANNIEKFEGVILKLEQEGVKVFSQIPFLDINLAQETKIHHFEDAKKFYEFYFPLFRSGLIKKAYFLPGWELSYGATSEHECCKENNISIIYL